jgi:hypothetical protein
MILLTCGTRSFVQRKNDDSRSGEIQTVDDLKSVLRKNGFEVVTNIIQNI